VADVWERISKFQHYPRPFIGYHRACVGGIDDQCALLLWCYQYTCPRAPAQRCSADGDSSMATAAYASLASLPHHTFSRNDDGSPDYLDLQRSAYLRPTHRAYGMAKGTVTTRYRRRRRRWRRAGRRPRVKNA